MTIKIFSIVVYRAKTSNFLGVFPTKSDTYVALLDNLGLNGESEADLILGTGDLEQLEEFLQKTQGGIAWTIDSHEIEVPIVGELIAALENARITIFAASGIWKTWEPELNVIDKVLSKAKGAPAKTTPMKAKSFAKSRATGRETAATAILMAVGVAILVGWWLVS